MSVITQSNYPEKQESPVGRTELHKSYQPAPVHRPHLCNRLRDGGEGKMNTEKMNICVLVLQMKEAASDSWLSFIILTFDLLSLEEIINYSQLQLNDTTQINVIQPPSQKYQHSREFSLIQTHKRSMYYILKGNSHNTSNDSVEYLHFPSQDHQ